MCFHWPHGKFSSSLCPAVARLSSTQHLAKQCDPTDSQIAYAIVQTGAETAECTWGCWQLKPEFGHDPALSLGRAVSSLTWHASSKFSVCKLFCPDDRLAYADQREGLEVPLEHCLHGLSTSHAW